MNLSEASLTELVAELRERLRHFASGPPGVGAPKATAGPLDQAGRAALAARLLAVVLASRKGRDAAEAARAFESLAEALAGAPTPLPGSAWEADLGLLARSFETTAAAWDRDDTPALATTWRDLRLVGDRLWSRPGEAGPAVAAPEPQETQGADPAPSRAAGRSIWLLVAGSIRRASLGKRLRSAGFVVDCPETVEDVIARLADERPAAVVCDDAAPAHFRSHLLGRLPESAPPVILLRSRTTAVDPGGKAWLPPYDIAELLDRLDS